MQEQQTDRLVRLLGDGQQLCPLCVAVTNPVCCALLRVGSLPGFGELPCHARRKEITYDLRQS